MLSVVTRPINSKAGLCLSFTKELDLMDVRHFLLSRDRRKNIKEKNLDSKFYFFFIKNDEFAK